MQATEQNQTAIKAILRDVIMGITKALLQHDFNVTIQYDESAITTPVTLGKSMLLVRRPGVEHFVEFDITSSDDVGVLLYNTENAYRGNHQLTDDDSDALDEEKFRHYTIEGLDFQRARGAFIEIAVDLAMNFLATGKSLDYGRYFSTYPLLEHMSNFLEELSKAECKAIRNNHVNGN